MYGAQNLRDRIERIKQWLDTQGTGVQLSEADLNVYEMISEADAGIAEVGIVEVGGEVE